MRRFCIGLGKKVLVANTLGEVADSVFAIHPGQLTAGVAWLGTLTFTLQIYFDFSGYSDMAIGLGRIFGFHFPENFRYPYISRSLTEFWRRWHISLSTWFRDYLYIPLGGNRRGARRTALNLLLVFLLCGLWHGASWTFVVWGLYHGSFLAIERGFRGRAVPSVWLPLRGVYTLLVVAVGWVIFRADTLPHALAMLGALVGFGMGDGLHYSVAMYTDRVFLLTLLVGVVLCAPVVPAAVARWNRWLASRPAPSALVAAGELLATCAVLALLFGVSLQLSIATHNPFIYFRF